MISIEEISVKMGDNQSIDGAINAFVEYIEGLDIDYDTKLNILCKYNSAISESYANAISQTLSMIYEVDYDSVKESCHKHYERESRKLMIQTNTRRINHEGTETL